MTMKIAMLGNCQVDVYRHLLLASHQPIISELKIFEVWRYRAESFSDIAEQIEDCDLIMTQTLADSYGPISTSALEKRSPKLVRIINIFFSGYVPDCTYIGPMGARMKSIVGDYHSRHVYDSWSKDKPLNNCIDELRNYDQNKVTATFQASSEELRRREAEVDVPVSDLVLDHTFGLRNFFTFNHPKLELHRLYLERILEFVGLGTSVAPCQDPLMMHTHWPIYPAVYAHFGLNDHSHDFQFTAPRSLGGRSYTLEQFCEQCYRHYSQNA